MQKSPIDNFIEFLEASPGIGGRIVHHAIIPPDAPQSDRGSHAPSSGDWDYACPELYTFLEAGTNVLLTGDSPSGKSLTIHTAVIRELLKKPDCTALYILPTRALVRNQKALFEELAHRSGLAATVTALDSGTERAVRGESLRTSRMVLTTPDMLHRYILPKHAKFSGFISRIGFVCIDDMNVYRGAWGTQCSLVFRRLARILKVYRNNPYYIGASRPVVLAGDHAARLTGKKFSELTLSRRGSGTQHVFLMSMDLQKGDTSGQPVHDGVGLLLAKLVEREIRTIVFARSWHAVEWIGRRARAILGETDPDKAERVRTYRGGYLADVRTDIEQELFAGRFAGIVTTNALETGIHITGLDACIVVGFPGSVSSFRQMAGRVGRENRDSIVILAAYDTAVNRYVLNNPGYILDAHNEMILINPDNPYALSGQLLCALHELPMSLSEAYEFAPDAPAILNVLQEEKLVNCRKEKYFYASTHIPSRDVSLRSLSRTSYRIVEGKAGETIGFADERLVPQVFHPGAIYLHGDTTFVSERVDTEKKEVIVRATEVDYLTEPVMERYIRTIDHIEKSTKLPGGLMSFGEVTVEFSVTGFNKIDPASGEIIEEVELHVEPAELLTTALWISAEPIQMKWLAEGGEETQYYSVLRGAGHSLQIVTAMNGNCSALDVRDCYGWDCRFPIDPHTVFIFDNLPGGMGFAESAFGKGEELPLECIKIIKQCPCTSGCPSCVGYQVRPFLMGDPGRQEGGIAKKDLVKIWFEILSGTVPDEVNSDEEETESGVEIDTSLNGLTRMNLKRRLLRSK